ncbi:MAG TPA: ABC transporter ATP-binding protein, partial [Clostridia bacterium]|nr:ABC transporter ATP-binding protein [Clostridia bacterium]
VASVDPKLCGLALVGGLLFVLTDMVFIQPNRRIGAQIQEDKARANVRLGEAIHGALTIRLLGLAERMLGEHNQVLAEIRRLELLRARYRCAQAANDTWRGWVISVGILGVGCLEVARGAYSLADLMLITSMVGQLLYKFTLIISSVISMQQSAAAAERVVRALDEPMEDLRPAGQRVTPVGGIALALEGVTFSYAEDRGAPALDNVSLSLRRGETVALVGASGSGKTTVFRLLLGMATPQSGTVRLWGVPCAEASLETWRAQLAYVAQESPLFDGSLAENIGWGTPGCDGARIGAAAEAAYAADFIRQRPEGLNARTGTGGSLFSGGERQCIGIARAFARNAPILLLDEATSALDTASEEAVQAALNRLMAGRTVLVAAHRLSTIRNADRILVFEGGRIVEEGTHEALLRRGGVYQRLWAVQVRQQA